MSSFNPAYTHNGSIPEEPDVFDFDMYSPGSMSPQFDGSAASYYNDAQISSILNGFPSVPPHHPSINFESKPVSTATTHSCVSALTQQVRAHPELNQPQSSHYNPTPSSVMGDSINPFFYGGSFSSTFSSPNIMAELDQDQRASMALQQWEGMTTSPKLNHAHAESHAISAAMDIPNGRRAGGRVHRQPSSSRSFSYVPYPSSPIAHSSANYPTGAVSMTAATNFAGSGSVPTTSSIPQAGFTHEQVPAVQAILSYLRMHPNTAFPGTYITPELAEVYEGRGYCLIGNCAIERAAQKANPLYDPNAEDPLRKRVDHLYDHIRDKHFNCRPFQCGLCTQGFTREHDLKRHENTHKAMSLPCPIPECRKTYTRNDNLQRHITQKHPNSRNSIP